MSIQYEKSFASHEKSKFWSDKNELKPFQISKGTDKKYWFNCDKCNHEFIMQLNLVTKGGWCSVCSGHKICLNDNCNQCFEKSFASHEKAKYWSNKNELTPRQVFKSSAKKYTFNCDKCNHEFISNPEKVSIGRWCPYCCVPQKQLCGSKECSDCYNKSFASHEKSVYWSDKNEIKPEFVLKKGDKRIWFNCDKCDHNFEKQIKYVSNDGWCPYCNSYKLCENNDCINCFNRSFASHEKSKYWSNQNGEMTPRNIVKGSGDKYWFSCDKCCHEFIKSIDSITGIKNSWCPYCVNKKMCNNDDCQECYEKSFASHEKVKYWSSKNTENPRHLFQGDSNKYWFNCDKCNHDFDIILYNVKSGFWCPYCSHSKLCDNNCKECYDNSVMSHDIMKLWKWSSKNQDNPLTIFKNSNNKYWFECNKCNHEFERPPASMNGIYYNVVCPICRYKTELKLYNKLKQNYPTILREFRQEWCKKINVLPFDFCIQEYKIIIELDGPQHFQKISNWKPLELVKENDKYKEECANNNGYSVIRLLQEDVFQDKYDWIKELSKTIEEVKKGDVIVNIYLCKNGEYDTFVSIL